MSVEQQTTRTETLGVTLVTGASGFIGQHLVAALQSSGNEPRLLSRQPMSGLHNSWTGDLRDPGSMLAACRGVDTIFHCAGYAHAFAALDQSAREQHWQVNFEGTRNLYEAAARCGVKRLVFLSTVKAMADPGGGCVDEEFSGAPTSAYGKAKRAAEDFLLERGGCDGMQISILRLSMVYGPGSRGNLEKMLRLVRRGWFPPLPETGNHRSMVHVQDVVAAAILVAKNASADGKVYIVSGDEAPSGTQLFNMMRQAVGLPPARFAIPCRVLSLLARLGDWAQKGLHRRLPFDSEVLERLLGSAWYASTKIRRELGWRPSVALQAGINQLASSWSSSNHG